MKKKQNTVVSFTSVPTTWPDSFAGFVGFSPSTFPARLSLPGVFTLSWPGLYSPAQGLLPQCGYYGGSSCPCLAHLTSKAKKEEQCDQSTKSIGRGHFHLAMPKSSVPSLPATFSEISSRLGLQALLISRAEASTRGKWWTEKTNPRPELHTDDSPCDKGDDGDKVTYAYPLPLQAPGFYFYSSRRAPVITSELSISPARVTRRTLI